IPESRRNSMARTYKVVSADSHLEISPERWTDRIPAKYRDFAPRLVRLADGGDGILVENRPLYTLGLAVTGKPYEEHSPVGIKGVALGMFPSGKGFPTAEDDRFWAAAIDLNMPITVHIGFRAKEGPLVRFPKEPSGLARTANPAWLLCQRGMRASSAVQLM